MFDMIREAGFPVFAVLSFGLGSLALSVRQAVAPSPVLKPLLRSLILATVLLGVLGTAIGVQVSANAIGEVSPDKRWIFLIGLKESLHNLTIALVLVVPSLVLSGAGNARLAAKR